jgi:hypothetical protein
VGQLTWKSVGNDFLRQKRLCRKTRVRSKLYLVVPTSQLKSKLQQTQNSKAAKCAIVIVFPYKNVPLLVQSHEAFRNALIRLSPFSKREAENDKLLTLATFLCGHWLTGVNNKVSVADIARAMESEAAAFCRPLKGNKKIPPDIARMLSAIPGFTWEMRKGFLSWRYGATDSGRYPHHCWTSAFARLLKNLRKCQPKSFDAIESELR